MTKKKERKKNLKTLKKLDVKLRNLENLGKQDQLKKNLEKVKGPKVKKLEKLISKRLFIRKTAMETL